MRKIGENTREFVLELLQGNRSYLEISKRTGIAHGTIEEWATIWRKEGKLVTYRREGMAGVQKAKLLANGYYHCIRKRYNGMKWTDKLAKRNFGFKNSLESIHYFLEDGKPRPCAYCGALPPEGKVWGLDRLDTKIGHVPGNLVPCCSTGKDSRFLSCQTSKSSFDLYNWMESSMNRSYGKQLPKEVVETRLAEIFELAKELGNIVTN